MKPKVYIETSVIGAYFDKRDDVISKAQHHWTHLWWTDEKLNYEVVTSQAVVDELQNPGYPSSRQAVGLANDIPKLPLGPDVALIVKTYIDNQLMPRNPFGDALHLALASYHNCDYLLTWNCKHLANPNKFAQIRLWNTALGLHIPILTTPNQLIGGA